MLTVGREQTYILEHLAVLLAIIRPHQSLVIGDYR